MALLVAAAGAFTLYFFHKFNPAPPTSRFPQAANALEAQKQDITQFGRLIGMDRSFSSRARKEANDRIATLALEQTALDKGRFRVALMRITALADNGHTTLYSDENGQFNYIPIRVALFEDGLYVLRAKSAYSDLLGARVEQIEGSPEHEVIAALERLHGGTVGWRSTFAAIYVQSPEILHGARIGASPDSTTWTFRLRNGAIAERVLPGEFSGDKEPHDEMTRWLSPQKMKDEPLDWHGYFASDAGLPLPLRDFNDAFRRAWIGAGHTLFIQLKAIENVDEQRIGDFLSATADVMRARPPRNIILDLRFSTGGDYTNTAHFASHLPDFLAPQGHIYILTGPQTFSATITTASFVKQAAGSRAIILGEPVGDRLAFYAEGNAGCLPHAKLCVHYATGMHDYSRPCTDWDKCYWLNWLFPVRVNSLAPNETIGLSFADYSARRDPVFDRAVALANLQR
ncbi:MAG TPA: hypothetical protein VII49_05555 [Rhizomicrobium sp.]